MGRKSDCLKQFLKFWVVAICTAGFLLQTVQFMFLYWTYPTVVDIQVSIPSEVDFPGISLCNTNGIYPEVVCELGGICSNPTMMKFLHLCTAYPILCDENGKLPPDFRAIPYHKIMEGFLMNSTVLHLMRKPLSEFFKCQIVSDEQQRDCNIEDAVYSSYYADGFMPNFCFTINTLWSHPNKKILKIKKSEKIRMEFYMDGVDRNKSAPPDMIQYPKYNYPSNPSVQLAIHSPYLTVSPFLTGQAFLGGKRYEINLKQDEKHLLPPPYQTNCTDYMSEWIKRGGTGPLNQIMLIEECKYNASLEKLRCVPLTVDYPHNSTICDLCENCNRSGIWDYCTDLLNSYNQPCDFIQYDMNVEEKVVYIYKEYSSKFLGISEKAVFQQMGYNCSHEQVLTRRCQTVNIELVFDNFQITNVTYNPKYESLEVFSVIGGYMGMYLGISIVAVYDFAEMAFAAMYNVMKKRRERNRKKRKLMKSKAFNSRVVEPFQMNRNFRRRTTGMYYGDRY